jgi:carbonic anhydrase
MSQIVSEVLAANAQYAADFGEKGKLPLPPGPQIRDPDLYGCAP